MLAGVSLLALIVLPARFAAFRGDDAWTLERRGLLQIDGVSLLHDVVRDGRVAIEAGRPQILGGQGAVVAWIFDGHPVAYRLFLIALTMVAAALLFRLVVLLGASALQALAVLVILAGAIQFRTYHDAMLGYYGIVQLVLIFTLASLIWFVRWLRDGERRSLVISFLLFLPCPFLYEISYPLAALFLAAALLDRRSVRAALRAALPFLALAAVFAVASFVGRMTAPAVVASYSVGSSPSAFVRTYLIQLVSPLPGSVMLDRSPYFNHGLGSDPTKAELLAGAWRGAVVFALLLVLFLRSVRTRTELAGVPLGALALLGVTFYLGPPLLLAIAPKFQDELNLGRGHFPMLIQVFGWALVATAASLGLLRAASGRGRVLRTLTAGGLALVLGAAAGFVGYTNLRVIGLETPVRETRALADQAVEAGLLSETPERSSLLFSKRDLGWPLGNWGLTGPGLEAMMLHRGDRLFDARIVGLPDLFTCPPVGFPPQNCAQLSRRRAWVHIRARPGGGTVILATTVPHEPAGTVPEVSREQVSSLRVFVTGDVSPPVLVGLTSGDSVWNSQGLRWRRARAGDGWAIYEATPRRGAIPAGGSLDDPRARVSFARPAQPSEIVRIYGTKRLLP